MQSVPPGPEQDRLRAAMEREKRAFEQGLLDGPPFPVHGITSPLLTVAMVGGYSLSDGALDSLELQYGTDDFQRGPTASVTTAPYVDGFCVPCSGSTAWRRPPTSAWRTSGGRR